jgi:HlyD family secretion protein
MAKLKRKNRRKILIFTIIGLALAGSGLYAYLRRPEPVISIQTEKVTRRNLTELVVANGRIQPVWQVKISPEVSGEIIELAVKEGQQVKKGDLLLKIKPDMYIANSNSAQASFKASLASKNTAAANLRKAEAEYKRIEELYHNKLVSDSSFLDAKTVYEIAKSQLAASTHQVEMAEAALRRADEDLRKTTIVSPLDGTVSKLNSQRGERVVGTAMMAGTEIMIVADLNEMEARVDIGEIDVVLIAVGQQARLEVEAFRDKKFTGAVTEIANSSKTSFMGGGQSQEATKFEVKIRIKEKEIFRPGMSVTAEIETRYRTNALTVPIASVTTRLPKETTGGKSASGKKRPNKPNTPPAGASATNPAPNDSTNSPHANPTNPPSASSTNSAKAAEGKKPGDPPKPIEVVFLSEAGKAKMIPVKRGISDDAYVEIIEGVKEGQEVVAGGYKAISRELEDGKRIRVGQPKSEPGQEKK